MLKLALAAALAAIPAAAMADSYTATHRFPDGETYRTDCYSGRYYSHCSTTKERPRYDPKIFAEGERLLAEQRRAQGEPRNHTTAFQDFRVTKFVVDGDCPGARRYASDSGNAGTIARVEGLCGKEAAK